MDGRWLLRSRCARPVRYGGFCAGGRRACHRPYHLGAHLRLKSVEVASARCILCLGLSGSLFAEVGFLPGLVLLVELTLTDCYGPAGMSGLASLTELRRPPLLVRGCRKRTRLFWISYILFYLVNPAGDCTPVPRRVNRHQVGPCGKCHQSQFGDALRPRCHRERPPHWRFLFPDIFGNPLSL